MLTKKVLVVEGKADKFRLKQMIDEPVTIICTFGTISEYDLEELLDRTIDIERDELYVFVDADYTGEQIRALFHQLYPEAIHLFTNEEDVEVECTPFHLLAEELQPYFQIHAQFLHIKDE
ncbi:MAG TPA: hypothetical protein VK120_03900 [Sporosarcina sp.]|nr:hypothetical protein [Sporosarcina sp.]